MKYKIVVFGVKQSTISLIETFKDDIDLIITVDDNIKQNNHIAGEGSFSEFIKTNNIECYSVGDYSLKTCQDFFNNAAVETYCRNISRLFPERQQRENLSGGLISRTLKTFPLS